MEITSTRNVTMQQMHDYIERNCPEDKEWFLKVAFKDGKYNHLNAKKAFIERYCPDLVKSKKPTAKDIFGDWMK